MSLRMTPMPITVGQVHPSWLRDLERAAISTDHLEDVVKLTLSDVSYDLSSIAQSMPKVGPVGLSSSKVQAVVAAASKAQRSIPELRASYVTLADSFEDIQEPRRGSVVHSARSDSRVSHRELCSGSVLPLGG